MNDDFKKARQPVTLACAHFVEMTRTALTDSDCRVPDALINNCQSFQADVDTAASQSFLAISKRIERLLLVCRASGHCLNPLEKEVVELAADWLEQLSRLYGEGIPEPETLVKELLYAFDLVEKSHGATTLTELLLSRPLSDETEDMFAHDPEPAVDHYLAPQQSDPFAGDPGFGMEFDLLQRTFNVSNLQDVAVDDLFTEDDCFDGASSCGNAEAIPYDVFEDDPEPGG